MRQPADMMPEQTITYELGDALYINITNHCTNHCSFCVRNNTTGIGCGINLWLTWEPTVAEVLADIARRDVSEYKEFVFCGYGEPMTRLDDMIAICKKLKEQYHIPVRINTNGQANLIYRQDVTPQLAGLVDAISISLNAKDRQSYQAICMSDFGAAAFDAVVDFAVKCKQYIPRVALSVVDVMTKGDIQACREIARQIDVDFKIRQFMG